MSDLDKIVREQQYRPCPAGESKSVWREMEELRLKQESQEQPQVKKKGRPKAN